ncbi:MAG: hypothetical protein HC880_13965 [Bacteroidia bacterium]|nr:hypothetical protein [Bacteroidia bacterium]
MIAAQMFNQKAGIALPTIFGSITTGKVWKFLQLDEDTLRIDTNEYYEKHELQKILGILRYIVDFYLKSLVSGE